MDGLEGEKENLEVNSELNREPVKLLEYRGDVMKCGGLGNDACS